MSKTLIERLRCCRGMCAAQEECLEAAAEIERLTTIVESLPKTADGVPVVPGKDSVWHPEHLQDYPDMLIINEVEFAEVFFGPADEVVDASWPVSECYSTRELAVAARKGKDAH